MSLIFFMAHEPGATTVFPPLCRGFPLLLFILASIVLFLVERRCRSRRRPARYITMYDQAFLFLSFLLVLLCMVVSFIDELVALGGLRRWMTSF